MPFYELEPYSSYSGSYTDDVITGSLTPSGNTWVRGRVGSNAMNSASLYIGITQYGVYKRLGLDDAQLSKNPKILNLKTSNRIYDSLPPDLEQIWSIDNAKVCLTNYNNPSKTILRIAFIVGLFEDGTEYKLTSSVDTTNVISNQRWTHSYPFETKYRTVRRRKDDIADSSTVKIFASASFARVLTSPYNVAGTTTVGKTINDIVYSAGDAFFGGQSTINRNPALIYGFYRKRVDGVDASATHTYFPCEEADLGTYPPVLTVPIPVNTTIGPAVTEDIFKMIYGVGGGPNNTPEFFTTASFAVADQGIRFGFGSKIRGWKYGLQSGLPLYEKMVVNRNHYGFLRDVLEPRLYTKIVKPDGTIESPIQVSFISGTQDYLTASDQSLNTRSSGLYNVFYASGAPWAE